MASKCVAVEVRCQIEIKLCMMINVCTLNLLIFVQNGKCSEQKWLPDVRFELTPSCEDRNLSPTP